MAMIQRIRIRIRNASQPRNERRRWLRIERLESRSMLDGDDLGLNSEFDFDFDFDSDGNFDVDDFNSSDCFHDQQDHGLLSDSISSSFDFFDDEYSYFETLDQSFVDDWDDSRFDDHHGYRWDDHFGHDELWRDDPWRDTLPIRQPLISSSIVDTRPAPSILVLLMPILIVPKQEQVSLDPPQRATEVSSPSNRIIESRDSLAHAALNSSGFSDPVTRMVLRDVGNDLSAAPDEILFESKRDQSPARGVSGSETVAGLAVPRAYRSPMALPHGIPRSLGPEGMLLLDPSDASADVSQPSDFDDGCLESRFGGKIIESGDRVFSLSNEEVFRGLKQFKGMVYGKSAYRFDADSSSGGSRRQSESPQGAVSWPQGMLVLDITPSAEISSAPMIASMDPLALVQLFIQADGVNRTILDSAMETTYTDEPTAAVTGWKKWLRDPRISAVASVVLGIAAVATARRTNRRE